MTGGREIIFEHVVNGAYLKTSAIDVATGIEVSVIAPAHAAQSDCERLATRKLLRRLDQGKSGKTVKAPGKQSPRERGVRI